MPLRRGTRERQEALNMVYATMPVLIAAGVLLASGILEHLRAAHVVAWAGIIFAVPLYLADRFGGQDKMLDDMNPRSTFIMGLAQMLALIPGASRAGVTLMAGRRLGFSREAAARYSMLMAMPVILCFALFGLLELISAQAWGELGDAALGAGLAAIFAFVTIDVFLRMTRKLSLTIFVLYRLALGGAILLFF
jgi:undecaprenyl-diphosphatase